MSGRFQNSDDPNPSIDMYPVFLCGSADLNNEKSRAVVKHLMAELNLRKKTTPLTWHMKQRNLPIRTVT